MYLIISLFNQEGFLSLNWIVQTMSRKSQKRPMAKIKPLLVIYGTKVRFFTYLQYIIHCTYYSNLCTCLACSRDSNRHFEGECEHNLLNTETRFFHLYDITYILVKLRLGCYKSRSLDLSLGLWNKQGQFDQASHNVSARSLYIKYK